MPNTIGPDPFCQPGIGVALAGQRKFAEAEPILLEIFEGLRTRRSSTPPELYIGTIQAIIDLYVAMEKPEEAERWRKELNAATASSGG